MASSHNSSERRESQADSRLGTPAGSSAATSGSARSGATNPGTTGSSAVRTSASHAPAATQPPEQKMAGHWLLASMGKKVLRPGGRGLTQRMLSHLPIGESDDVVEFGPGLGITAEKLLAHNPKSYCAVDRDSAVSKEVQELLNKYPQARYVNSDARKSGLDDACASVVVGEAMLTMLSQRGKQAVMNEASRLLRPGGYYAIHEIAFVPDDCPQELQQSVCKELRESIKVSAEPITSASWKNLLEQAGFELIAQEFAPMALLNPKRIIADEGIFRALGFACRVMKNPAARERIRQMRRVFTRNQDSIKAIALVARKRTE